MNISQVFKLLTDKSTRKYLSAFSLLVCCLFVIFILPVVSNDSKWIYIASYSYIIFLAAYLISQKTMYVALVAIGIEYIAMATNYTYMHFITEIVSNILLFYIIFEVIRSIQTNRNVTIYSLIEALIGYLLIALMFSSIVNFCFLHVPEGYSIAEVKYIDMIYYTVVTLTSTGYGDIVPIHPITKSLGMFIAMTGQFYIAIIVAIIVGKYSHAFIHKNKND